MTQSNGANRLDQIENALIRFIAASDARISLVEQQTSENSQAIQAISRDLAQLVSTQRNVEAEQQQLREEQQPLRASIDRLSGITECFIDATLNLTGNLIQKIDELRAGQEQQARVLDYLLQKEIDRQNG